MIGWKWSAKEKLAARRAFNMALDRELAAVTQEVKQRAERIKEASDLWEMETWLTGQRERIDGTFDFRYSVLARVFATLVRERRLSLDELHGLAQEKLDTIERLAQT
jgi:Photoprotection regulator fluorescence recovery protein